MNPKLKNQALREWRRGAADLPSKADKSVSKVLEKILPKLGLDQQIYQSKLLEDWPRIVGATVAKHARPLTLKEGILTIAVDHPMWLSELSRYQKPLLLRKVRQNLGDKTVKDIAFRIHVE